MSAPYGYCPRCGGLGINRERRLNGNDRCENGHSYPSSTAVANPLLPVSAETKRADSLALAYREQQGENDALRAANTVLLAERDLYREAWAKAQAHIDCGKDVADAFREERAAVVAWLREQANAPHPSELGAPMLSPSGRGLLLLNASAIERGEHNKENK